MSSARIPRPTSPRLSPVTEITAELAEIFPKTLIRQDGKPINIFGTLAHHPRALKRFNVFGGLLLNGLLPVREREIAILRVGWNCRSVYEFGQHTIIGRRSGMSDIEIAALCGAPEAHPWSADERALIDLADDICADNCASDATWAALRPRWSDAELVELVLVVGNYRLVSGFLNTMGVQLDEGVPSWPPGVVP